MKTHASMLYTSMLSLKALCACVCVTLWVNLIEALKKDTNHMEKVSVCKQKRQYVSDAFEILQSKVYMYALAGTHVWCGYFGIFLLFAVISTWPRFSPKQKAKCAAPWENGPTEWMCMKICMSSIHSMLSIPKPSNHRCPIPFHPKIQQIWTWHEKTHVTYQSRVKNEDNP